LYTIREDKLVNVREIIGLACVNMAIIACNDIDDGNFFCLTRYLGLGIARAFLAKITATNSARVLRLVPIDFQAKYFNLHVTDKEQVVAAREPAKLDVIAIQEIGNAIQARANVRVTLVRIDPFKRSCTRSEIF
jgi:hypothetical protein